MYSKAAGTKLFLIGMVALITSCGSADNITVRSQQGIEFPSEIDYFSMVYSFDEDFEVQNRWVSNLVKYTNHGLDSVMTYYPERFNLHNKIVVEEQETGLRILDEAAFLFEEIIKANSLSGIRVPQTIDSVSKSNGSGFVLLSYMRPVTKKKRAQPGKLHLTILDLRENKVSYYGSTGVGSGAYSAQVAIAFEEILERWSAGQEF